MQWALKNNLQLKQNPRVVSISYKDDVSYKKHSRAEADTAMHRKELWRFFLIK